MCEVRKNVLLWSAVRAGLIALGLLGWLAASAHRAGAQAVSAGSLGFANGTGYQATRFESKLIPDDARWSQRVVPGTWITVTRTGGTDGRILVDYQTQDGTATNGLDYVSTSGTLTFDDFQTSARFFVPIIQSAPTNETSKTFNLVLANPRPDPAEEAHNPGLLVPSLAGSSTTVTIREILGTNFNGGTNFSIEKARYFVDETPRDGSPFANAFVVVDVILPAGGPGEVDYRLFNGLERFTFGGVSAGSDDAHAGTRSIPAPLFTDGMTNSIDPGDYIGGTTRLQFGNNQTRVSVTNFIQSDSVVEFNEDFRIELRRAGNNQPPLGGNPTALITILYEDAPAGSLDREWNPDDVPSTTPRFNRSPGANNPVRAIAVQDDQKSVIVGDFTAYNAVPRSRIARINFDGSHDPSFNPGSGADDSVEALTLYPSNAINSGKMVIGGAFTSVNNIPRRGVARLLPDGTLDTSFNPGSGADGIVHSVALQSDGKVLIAGDFTHFDGVPRSHIARLNSNGTLDSGFNPGAGADGAIWSVVVVENAGLRSIYVGGEFFDFDGRYRGGVARLGETGSLDLNFDAGGGADGPVYAMAAQSDGRLLVGGAFSSIDFRSRRGIARLDTTGALDPTFDPGTGANDAVYSIFLQPDGKPLVGGLFTSFNQTRRMGLTRLFVNGTVDTSFLDTAYNQFAGLVKTFHYEPANFVNGIAVQTNGDVMIAGSFSQLGGGFSSQLNTNKDDSFFGFGDTSYNGVFWTRADKRARSNVARLLGGGTIGPGNVELVAADNYADEHAGTVSVALQRRDGRVGTVSVLGTTVDGSATAPSDYSQITFNPFWSAPGYNNTNNLSPSSIGEVEERFFGVSINDDLSVEGDEALNLLLSNPAGALVLGGEFIPLGAALGHSLGNLTIADNDFNRGVFAFSYDRYATNENAGSVRVTVIRTNGSFGAVDVKYFTVAGSASPGSDYTASQGTLRFSPGQTSAVLTNILLDDFTVEPDETFLIVLTNSTGGVSFPGGAPSIATTVSIIDNDYLPGRANFDPPSATYSTNEGAGFARVTLVRLGGSVGQLSVSVAATDGTAIGGSDYTALTNTVTWVHGDVAPKTFLVPLLDDLTVEADKTVNLRIFNPSPSGGVGTINTATLTIVDDDVPGRLSFSQPIYDIDERGTNVTITVVRSSGLGGTVSADYQIVSGTAVNGTDFSAAATGTLTLGPGVSAATFSIAVIDNGVTNVDRTADLNLINFVNASPGSVTNATLRILDDESFGDPAGSIDTTFAPQPGANDSVNALALQPDGRILAAGAFRTMNRVPRNRIARLNWDGSLDTTFNAGPGPNQPVRAMALQPDGRIVIGGLFTQIHGTNRNFVARLLSDGAVDTLFNPGGGPDNPVFTLSLLDDGGVVMGGSFASINGVSRPGIAVLNSDGRLRTSFDPGTGVDGTVLASAVQPDGKILIGGDFQSVQGAGYRYLARLHPNGLVDVSFNTGTGPNGPVRTLGIQADGKILIGGSFTTVDGSLRGRIARLFGDGALDPFYQASLSGANGDVLDIELQYDGRAIVVGDFTNFNAVARNNITRLLPNGKTDTSINFGDGANQAVNAALVQPDRRIVLGGRFTAFDGAPRNYLARIHGGSIAGTGRLQFSTPYYEVTEALGQITIVVERHGGTAGDVAVDYASLAGSATSGLDYTDVVGTLVFPEGEVRQTFTIPVANDLTGEPPEDVILMLSNPTGDGTLGDIPIALLTIISDDSQLGFTSSTYSVIESALGGNILATVIRTGTTNGGVQVTYSSTAGSATAGVDYSPVSGVLTFAPGETLKTITIPILDDNIIEGNETFGLLLTNVVGSVALGQATSTVTIVDNDFRAGTLTFSATLFSTNEAAGAFTITVLRTNGSTGPISVNYATAPGNAVADVDYTSASGTLTFIEGQTSAVILVPIIDDSVVEGDETLSVAIFNPVGGATIAGVTNVTAVIQDNEFGAGSLDLTFDPGAGANGLIRSIAVQTDGRIVVGGGFTQFGNAPRARVARVQPDGSLDTTFSPGTGANGFVSGVGATPSGRIVIAGVFSQVNGVSFNRVAQLLGDGAPDLNFSRDAQLNAGVNSVTLQSNGRILLGGGFSLPTRGISRLQASGAIDTTFNPASGADSQVHCIAVQTDGKVVLGGAFTSVAGEPHARVARVDATGLLDVGFLDGAITNGAVLSVALQTDGKIVVGGDFQTVAGTNHVGVARINADGTLDSSFNVGAGANGTVYAVGVQSTGKILVAGDFTTINGTNRNRYARLNTNGSLDLNFDPGQGANGTVMALAILSDDNIILAGDFTAVTGVPRFGLARVRGADPGPTGAFSAVSISAGVLQISINSHSGQTCILEATTNFLQWSPVATNVATGPICTFQQPNMTAHAARFFRIRQVQP